MYDIDIDRAVELIGESKKVLIQLPDGLKPKAELIQNKLESRTDAEIFFWAGSCYGACDIPTADVDLIIQWGHSEWS